MTTTMSTHRAQAPRITPRIPPVPRDPAASDHGWPDRWPRRTYLELAALDTAPGRGRNHARAVLREWGLDAAGEEAALIVSEILTNAMHSTQAHQLACPVRIWMLGDASSVLFLIWDATRPPPARRDAAPDAEHGRGLTIVEALSDKWGFYHPDPHPGDDQRPGGKVTWALMRPPAPAVFIP